MDGDDANGTAIPEEHSPKYILDASETLIPLPFVTPHGVNLIETFIMEAIHGALSRCVASGVSIDKANLMPFTSHSLRQDKFSMHIVLTNNCYKCSLSCKEMFKKCSKVLPSWLIPFIDVGVYKRNQGFRLMGSSKMNSHRPKVLRSIDGYYSNRNPREAFMDSLLSIVDDDVMLYSSNNSLHLSMSSRLIVPIFIILSGSLTNM